MKCRTSPLHSKYWTVLCSSTGWYACSRITRARRFNIILRFSPVIIIPLVPDGRQPEWIMPRICAVLPCSAALAGHIHHPDTRRVISWGLGNTAAAARGISTKGRHHTTHCWQLIRVCMSNHSRSKTDPHFIITFKICCTTYYGIYNYCTTKLRAPKYFPCSSVWNKSPAKVTSDCSATTRNSKLVQAK